MRVPGVWCHKVLWRPPRSCPDTCLCTFGKRGKWIFDAQCRRRCREPLDASGVNIVRCALGPLVRGFPELESVEPGRSIVVSMLNASHRDNCMAHASCVSVFKCLLLFHVAAAFGEARLLLTLGKPIRNTLSQPQLSTIARIAVMLSKLLAWGRKMRSCPCLVSGQSNAACAVLLRALIDAPA